MNGKAWNQETPSTIAMKVFVMATVLLGLAACGHHPHPGNCCTKGDRFLGSGVVKTVYQLPDEDGESPPIKAGDEFKIERDSKNSSIFRFVPGEGFTGDSAWAELKLEYQQGIESSEPIPLIAEICTSGQISRPTETAEKTSAYNRRQDKEENGYVKANVQYDFLNLDGRGLEFLQGPIKFNGIKNDENHMIHIFHFKKIGSEKRSLMIFYCETDNCNHNGGAHGQLN